MSYSVKFMSVDDQESTNSLKNNFHEDPKNSENIFGDWHKYSKGIGYKLMLEVIKNNIFYLKKMN